MDIKLTTDHLCSVLHNGTNFIVLSSQHGYIYTSTDGEDWTAITTNMLPLENNNKMLRDMAYSGSMYVVVGYNGIISKSTNLSTWTDSRILDLNGQWMETAFGGIVYANNMFVCVGKEVYTPGTVEGYMSRSLDNGSTWQSKPLSLPVSKIRYINNKLLAMGERQSKLLSTDGWVWSQDGSNGKEFYSSVAYRNSVYWGSSYKDIIQVGNDYIVLKDNKILRITFNGNIQNTVSEFTAPTTFNTFGSLSFGNSKYLAIGDDGGMYLSTDNGMTWRQVGKRSSSVLTLNPIVLTNTEINLDMTITSDGGSSITERGFVIGETTPTTLDNIIKNNECGIGIGIVTKSISIDIVGLLPAHTYKVRGYAINGVATTYTDELTFTLPAKGATINIGPITNETSKGFTVACELIADGGANVYERGIVLSTQSSPTIADTKIINGEIFNSFTTVVDNLMPNGTYYVRAFATNSIGTSYSLEQRIYKSVVTNVGIPRRSRPVLAEEGQLDPNIVKLTLVGFMRDRSHAPLSTLNNTVWTISNPSVGRIEGNYFIPIANGTTQITATIEISTGRFISTTGTIVVGDLYLDRISTSEKTLNIIVGTVIDIKVR